MNGKQQTHHAHLKSHRPEPFLTSNDSFYGLQIVEHFEFFSNRTYSCQMETIIKRTLALDNLVQKIFQVKNEDIHQNMKEKSSVQKNISQKYIQLAQKKLRLKYKTR